MLLDFILHIDNHLDLLIQNYHGMIYFILFLIIFVETGLVIMPFLPGDSLLFAVGAISARGHIDFFTIGLLLILAAFLGDFLNYFLGKKFGHHFFTKEKSFWFNPDHLHKANLFYEKYGAKTIVFARFIPIVRTFAPFVAGIGEMNSKKFMTYNFLGGALWVISFLGLGHFFGNLPAVRANFKMVILAIMIISIMPAVLEYFKKTSESDKQD